MLLYRDIVITGDGTDTPKSAYIPAGSGVIVSASAAVLYTADTGDLVHVAGGAIGNKAAGYQPVFMCINTSLVVTDTINWNGHVPIYPDMELFINLTTMSTTQARITFVIDNLKGK